MLKWARARWRRKLFCACLGPKPYKVAYVQPSRRPADGRYGENPNRLFKHTQLQVILKPPPENVQELYLDSLGAIGIDLRQHDIKFEEDNWESPTLGAWGIGWQVMLDGLEITQFTYFQQCGGVDLDPDFGGIDLWAGAHRGVPAGCGFDLRHRVGARSGDRARGDLWRCAAGGRVAVFRVQLRSRRCGEDLEAFRAVRSGVQSAAGRDIARSAERARPGLREKNAVSAAGRLRSLPEMLAPVQHSGCARRDFGDRTGGSDCAGAGPGGGHCQGLCGSAEAEPRRDESRNRCARRRSQISAEAAVSGVTQRAKSALACDAAIVTGSHSETVTFWENRWFHCMADFLSKLVAKKFPRG